MSGSPRCTLELGGKSAAIVMDDYDVMTAAVKDRGSRDVPFRSGMLLTNSYPRYAEAARRPSSKKLSSYVRDCEGRRSLRSRDSDGPARDEPPASTELKCYIAKGKAEGATLSGGRRSWPAHLNRGYYIEPTVFGNVDNNYTIAREEIFGPVITVIPVANEDQRHRDRQ